MASLTRRTVILIICRMMNFAVLILSPMFLVRIFDVTAYGQYREFVLYAALLSGILDFAINSNPIYFVPKYTGDMKRIVSHTVLMTLVMTTFGSAAIYLGRGLILSRTSYDFILPLILYIFFFLNLGFIEYFWLGKKRTDYVLYYSSARAIVRVVALVTTAYLTRDVVTVIRVLVVLEIVRCLFVLIICRNSFTLSFDRAMLAEQIKYIVPLGSTVSITQLNTQLAKLVISATLGAEKLAIYAIGNYQLPFINIVRSSVMDVLFPEMVQVGERDRITLWKKANVIFCFMIFPIFIVFFFHARTFIVTLFTEQYLSAVPLFRIYLLLMLMQCFEMGTPIRAINRNKYFVIGNVLNLVTNIGLIYLLFSRLQILAPAIAFILGNLLYYLYLAGKIISVYRLKVGTLFMWRKVFLVILVCAVLFPVLYLFELFDIGSVLRATISSSAYLMVYLGIMRMLGIEEVNLLFSKLFRRRR